MHIAQTSTMKCSLEQCFFSYAALTYEQHVSVFFFFFVVFIVSDLIDLIYMYTKIFVLFSYDVTSNAYIGNTCKEIFRYYYTENYSIIMFLFIMHTFLLFYTPLLLLSLLEQCFFSYAALTYEQHVSIFFFFFAVFIVSDLNDLIHMYTKIFVLFSYNVTINAYIGNTYNEIFKYYYTENYSIIMFLFVMRTFLLFYTPLSLLSLLLLLLLLLSMIYTCRSQFANQKCWSDFTQFIVSALKLNVSTFINPIFYLYRSRITNQLVWYDFTLFIVSITTLCYVYICLGVLYGDLFYSLT